MAYLGPGAGWDGGRENFQDSRRSGVPIRAQGPKLLGEKIQKTSRGGPGPGPWACAQGPGPWARALGLCPGSWALGLGPGPVPRVLGLGPGPVPRVLGPGAQGPGPWARALVLCPGSWALAQGPKSEKCKMAKSTSEEKMQPRTFRMARIDPSRQGVMNERSFMEGGINF